MKITIERDEALKALNLVQGAVAKRGTIPILANVLMIADNDYLSITATDMTITAKTTAKCAVDEAGEITIPAQHLADILRNLPAGAVLEMAMREDKRLGVKAGRSQFKIPTLPAVDFPSLTGVPMISSFEITAGALAGIIDDSAFAGDPANLVRPLHSSLCLHAAGDCLRGVATRGQILGYAQTPCGASAFPETVIPLASVSAVQKLLTSFQGADLVSVVRGEGRISFALGDTLISTQILPERFWDYERLIPKTFANELTADTDLLIAAIQRSTIMERNIRFAVKDGSLVLTGRSIDQGESGDEMDVECETEFSTTFLGSNLLETLAHIRTESVIMQFSGKGPVVVLETGEPSSLYIVMTLGA